MRRNRLRALAVSGAGTVVLAVVLFLATTVDTRPPTVDGYRLTLPAIGDPARAQTTTSIEIAFSEEVDRESAASAFGMRPQVDGALSWAGTTMIFTPDEPLALETMYEVSIGPGVRDRHGNVMPDAANPLTFTTVGRPELVETTPEDRAENVPLDAPIVLTFSTLMDTDSVERALSFEPAFAHELAWSGAQLSIIPTLPLRAESTYRIRVRDDATDIAGVELTRAHELRFTTLGRGLEVVQVLPVDGASGVALTTPIAITFDAPLERDALDEGFLTLVPSVAGSLELVPSAADDGAEASMLVFTPAASLPPNTTFRVEVSGEVVGRDGGALVQPVRWGFTTGASLATLSNQITFVSDRSGVANLWAMNEDGTGQRQLSAELFPVVDYAVAPDGRWYVVADGRRLILQRADGSQRSVLTDDAHVEYDPTFSADGRRIAFGRAEAESGEPLGLWERATDGGEAQRIELPTVIGPSPQTTGAAEPDATPGRPTGDAPLRAPRYSPDGSALAFVVDGEAIAIVELPAARLTRVAANPVGPPTWLPDSAALLVDVAAEGSSSPGELVGPDDRVMPLDAWRAQSGAGTPEDVRVARLSRSGTRLEQTRLGANAVVADVDAQGAIAVLRVDGTVADDRAGGTLEIASGASRTPRPIAALSESRVTGAAFAPARASLVVALSGPNRRVVEGGIWLAGIDDDERTRLAAEGTRPQWHP